MEGTRQVTRRIKRRTLIPTDFMFNTDNKMVTSVTIFFFLNTPFKMNEIEDFILPLSNGQQAVINYFHQLFINELELTFKIRYKIPFYYGKSWICYLNPTKNEKIELVFLRGRELSNIQGLLSDKGRKMVSGIEFASVEKIPIEEINQVIQEAIYLDEIGKS